MNGYGKDLSITYIKNSWLVMSEETINLVRTSANDKAITLKLLISIYSTLWYQRMLWTETDYLDEYRVFNIG